MRVVVSGGGTGGHIFPALAIVEALKRQQPDVEVLYVGSLTGMETQIVPAQGIPFQGVTARKLRKVVSFSTLGVGLSLLKGYQEARTYLKAFRADAVVGTGGYVAAATVLAGAHLGLPTLITASDVVPGRTNRMLARYATRICITFPESQTRFPREKTALTGLPLRSGVVAGPDISPTAARCQFTGLGPDAFTILVIGGSQGAQALNRVVLEAAPELLDAGAQILHQAGARNIEAVQQAASEKGLTTRPGYCALAFLDEQQMPLAYRAADVIVCRGGISTLSELTANGLPALIVPLPTAYADHQTANARALVTPGAALLRPESSLTGKTLATELLALRSDTTRRKQMAAASKGLGRPQAADAVARLIFEMKAERK